MNILDTLRERVTAAGTALMIEPLTAAEARELLAVVDAMADDKRRLAGICDDLSAQNAALNEAVWREARKVRSE